MGFHDISYPWGITSAHAGYHWQSMLFCEGEHNFIALLTALATNIESAKLISGKNVNTALVENKIRLKRISYPGKCFP
jgi:hypothetical protein